jgi:hypothetical protein
MPYKFGQSLAPNPNTGKPIGLWVAEIGNFADFWVWENGVCVKRAQGEFPISDIPIQAGIGAKPADEYEAAYRLALLQAFEIILFRLKLLTVDKQRIVRFQNGEHP